MNILVLSDIESLYLWDSGNPKALNEIDLILSCGDLDPNYLSFIATFAHAPVLYVHGNHDDCYEHTPPLGCTCIDGKLTCFQGVRILGLGGSVRYKNGTNQYTQREMQLRVFRILPHILLHRGFDILLTHSPALGINDGPDRPHHGFRVFNRLLAHFQPIYFIHGHTHLNYGTGIERCVQKDKTTVVNAFERYTIHF